MHFHFSCICWPIVFIFRRKSEYLTYIHQSSFIDVLISSTRRGFVDGLKRLTKLGIVVVLTFAALWLPWLGSKESALQVLHRIFPLARGVFEDKVSNVWCIINVAVPLR